MEAQVTVGEALEGARQALRPNTDTPGLEAQVLLAEVLSKPRSWILAHSEAILGPDEHVAFETYVWRCLNGEPLAYVLGRWEFFGREFSVGPGVLIPRPETELMVETALDFLAEIPSRRRVLEVGTGSGCVAITLAAEQPELSLIAADISSEALVVARSNALKHNAERSIRFIQADLADPIAGKYDLTCANLPYVSSAELNDSGLGSYEPSLALDGGPDGMACIRRLLASLPRVVARGGRALLEIGAGQATKVVSEARQCVPHAQISVKKDMAGLDRLVIIRM